jgi:hypothetical protein
VGTNRRYERHVGAQIDRRIEETAGRGHPIGLTDDELDKTRQRPTWAATPLPVWAWVRYPGTPVRVEGFAIAWTARAVMVEWQDRDTSRRLWVWASAVEARSAPAAL